MILNVSGRTDVVAFYTEWFINRYKEGYVDVRNPFNPSLVSRIKFENVDLIMFCTKNPLPIIKYLKDIDKPILFHITLTPYKCDIEPYLPDKTKIIEGIKKILSMMGEVLLNDGLSSFGMGNFTTGDEIGKYKYNEVKILTENTKKYEKLLKNNEIKRNDEVVLARYLTSKDNPGVCTRYKDSKGRDVYKIVDALKEVEGFYKYSMRNNVTQDEVII